LTQERIN
jgi:hypothetical protein